MFLVLLLLSSSFVFLLVHCSNQPPQCRWACDDPMCGVQCSPLCEMPNCTAPNCEISCVPQYTRDTCPRCQIHCQRPGDVNTCDPPKCAWTCVKPNDCPLPHCELVCERPSCESTVPVPMPKKPLVVITGSSPMLQKNGVAKTLINPIAFFAVLLFMCVFWM
jgi:hypothetical protein